MTRRLSLPWILAALACASPSAARELRWNAIDVHARLDAQGALHVVETQTMVFTGDWNGGERTFDPRPGQSVSLESMTRIDPDGTRHAMAQGGLSAVDEYGWTGENVLRWRSRLPSDPEFSNAELVYEIAYVISGVLVKQGDSYLLDHNFGLPAAEWPIRKLKVSLELDPVWKPEGAFPGVYESGVLAPRSNFTVTVPLSYTGSGSPAVSASVMGSGMRRGLLGVLAAAIVYLYLVWRRRETALGRFAPLTPPDAVDEAWLEKNLFSLAPEEAGALWDETIGAPEVAAVLARLSAEKKIATEASGKKLSMRLLVPVSQLHGYDQDLVQALFFGGRKETDTDAIKAHYKASGFDPSSKIKPDLEKKLKTLPDFQDKSEADGRLTLLLFLAGLAVHGYAVLSDAEPLGAAIGSAIIHLVLFGIAAIFAWAFQKRIDRLDAWSPLLLWAPALLFYFAWLGLRDGARTPASVVVGQMLLRLAVVAGIFFIAKTRNGPKRIARRKALASARRFFVAQLDRPAPRLKDEWFPYVVAFGLTSEADGWFKAHGAAAAATGASTWRGSSSGSSSSSSSPSGGGWTGGGGAFGGAGASGTWAVAAGALAAGVASPSSSSSGGGGGGGGGSSGGGGGGGW